MGSRALEDLLSWMRENLERRLVSPRKKVFGRGREPQDFKLVGLNEAGERVGMLFLESGTLLPLEFWRFREALELLSEKTGMVRLGTSLKSEDPDSLEWNLQRLERKLYERRSGTKTAPHVGDILVLAGLARYGWSRNPWSGRRNQAICLVESLGS